MLCLFLFILMLMPLRGTDAVHAEIEELIEQQQQQNKVVTTGRSQKIATTTAIHPVGTLDVQGDPGTESVCRYMGQCGEPGYKSCPIGSSCENIPGIKVGWCCQSEPQTASETTQRTSTHKTFTYTKTKKLFEHRNGKQIRKLYQPFIKIPKLPLPTQRSREKANVTEKRQKANATSNLRNRCNGTPVGKCGGPFKKKCPPYSKCSFMNNATGNGVCCRTRPSCQYGYTRTCSRAIGNQCETGSICKYLPGSKIGRCCRKTAEKAFCPSGDVGNSCSSSEPCNSDYECRYGFCCRKKSCPSNWVNEGTCNISPGAPICPKGSKCINGFCCRLPEVICPSGVFQSTCSLTKACKEGYSCRFGNCCLL